MDNSKNQKPNEPERRHYKRIKKNFILKYYDLEFPQEKFEVTQLKNISKGGLCMITSKKCEPPMKIGIELNTPYLTDTTYLEGSVLASHEKIKNLIYETRLQFEQLDPEAEFLIEKLSEFFSNEEG